MFVHNLKYFIRILFKNKTLIFWTFAFPIILGTLFNFAFSNINDSEKLKVFDIAIVNNSEFKKNEIYKKAFKNLGDKKNKDRLFNIKYVNKDKAKKLLNDEKIVGYLELKEKPYLIFKNNGINQTIFRYVTDEISETEVMIQSLSENEIKKGVFDSIIIKKNVEKYLSDNKIEYNNISNSNLDYVMIEFYTLIAMTCLYGGIFSMFLINKITANMSENGKRTTVAPTKKLVVVTSSLLASYIVQIIGLIILFIFTIFILKIDYGDNIPYIILLSLVGSLAGLSLGTFISSMFKINENSKIGMLIAITMLGCYLSGMMGITMKYVVDKNIPIINNLNPASMITDGFYSLYYYDTYSRFFFNIISLVIFSLLLMTLSVISLRRQKYDSI